MEMVPAGVERAAREWAEQQHDLSSAAALLAGADTAGFSAVTSGAAASFLRRWQQLVAELGSTAGAQATSLRATATDWLATDLGTAESLVAVGQRLEGRP